MMNVAHRMLRNLGAPIHCFGQLGCAIFLRSSLTTTTTSTQNLARFDKPRGTVRYGVIPKPWVGVVNPSSHPYTRARGFSKLCVTADRRPPLWPRLDQYSLTCGARIAPTSLTLRLAT